MSTLKVDNIRHNNATTDALVLSNDGSVAIGTCTAKLTSIGGGGLSHRNLIINGAMNVAQRAVTSTDTGYRTVDRFACGAGNVNESPTFAQVDIASGTTPYTLGFRKALKITNGNQTTLDTGDEINIVYNIEAQDLITSGWNYKSSSSFATWSFWIKSSVAQNFRGYIRSYDNTATAYAFETGNLSANTWTKIVRTIPGNSGLDIDNDNGTGLQLRLLAYIGTAYTDNSTPTHQWVTYNSSARTPDNTSTWYETNDATLEITGYQFEVGDTATSFEHISFGEELRRCQRYFYKVTGDSGDRVGIGGCAVNSIEFRMNVTFPTTMRALPNIGGTGTAQMDAATDSANFNCSALTIESPPTGLISCLGLQAITSGMVAGQGGNLRFRSDGSSITFDAEI